MPDSYEGRLHAVAAWIRDRGFFTGPTAAHLLQLEGVTRPSRIGVAYYGTLRAPSWVEIHRIKDDDVPPLRRANGFRVPCVERIISDCAGVLPARTVGTAVDDALRRRLTTLDRLWAFLETSGRGRRGRATLRKLLAGRDDRDERVRSRFETKMLTILRRMPEYPFVADHEVDASDDRYVLDFYCSPVKLGIECHSFRWHMSRHVADVKRDRRIRALGVELLYFTWDDVCFHSADVEKEIRAAIGRRLGSSQQKLALGR